MIGALGSIMVHTSLLGVFVPEILSSSEICTFPKYWSLVILYVSLSGHHIILSLIVRSKAF